MHSACLICPSKG